MAAKGEAALREPPAGAWTIGKFLHLCRIIDHRIHPMGDIWPPDFKVPDLAVVSEKE
jgi:hypothetical protein